MSKEIKRALLFSGGGSLCARQVGLLHSIANENPSIEFNTYAGVSGGSINAGFLHLADPSAEFAEQVFLLDSMWKTIQKNKDVYKERAFGIKGLRLLYAFIFGSLYKSSPLKQLLARSMDVENYSYATTDIYFGVVDFETGLYQELRPTKDNFIELLLASSAIPGAFRPRKIGESVLMDGGVRDNLPWKCVFREYYDEVYVLLSRSAVSIQRPVRRNPSTNVFKVAARAIEVGLGEIHDGDIKRLQNLEERGTKIKIYIPKHSSEDYEIAVDEDPLNFSNSLISERIDNNKNIKPISIEECLALFPYAL